MEVRAAFESGVAGTLRLLLDRRLVHRRLADRGLGVRPGRRERSAEAGVPRRAGAVRGAAAAAARAPAAGVGRDLRLQRRAHDGRVPRSRCAAELPELRGRRRQRRLDRRDARDRASATSPIRRRFILIDQENKGLSVARNVGIAAATGEIIAYTDSDCVSIRTGSPTWSTMVRQRVRRRRRPELPAAGAEPGAGLRGRVAGRPDARAAQRRGRRAHPGLQHGLHASARCARSSGFEPIFAAAGDDVDLCWRLQNRGYRSASARRRSCGTSAATR